MKEKRLTDAQRSAVVIEIENRINDYYAEFLDGGEDIDLDVDCEEDEMVINVKARIYISGYAEDDRYNGTGAWIETGREISIKGMTASDEAETFQVDNSDMRRIEAEINK